jgi:hypothetical protein
MERERKMERIGQITGRFPKYNLIVDGVDVGQIRRKLVKGKDGLFSRGQPSYDVWAIHGTELSNQAEAEAKLIERAKRFGYIK